MEERKVDVAVIGSGSAGLTAVGRIAAARKSFVLINGGPLGTTCARVGCMPSKAFIQVAEDLHRQHVHERFGITGSDDMAADLPAVMEHVRDLRDLFVERVISNSTDRMGDRFVEGFARFIEPGLLELDDGRRIRAGSVVIATGSQPIVPESWREFGDRIITTDSFFELEDLPRRVAVVGLGVIGLELGQAMARLGVEVTGIELIDAIGGISDPAVNEVACAALGRDLPIWLGHSAEVTEAADDGALMVSAGDQSVEVDAVLASLGRRPNLARLELERLGIALDANGLPPYDPDTLQVAGMPIFIAGDVNGSLPILHEANDDGRIAGSNAAAGTPRRFRRRAPLAITFCDPNIVSIGARFADLDEAEIAIGEMQIPPVGRALIMGNNRGLIRVYADRHDGRLLGSEMCCVRAEHLAHLLAWSLQQGMTIGQMLRMPFYHPVMEEALQGALNDAYAKIETKNDGPVTELETF